jgi:LEA14-like dessication related protein
MNKYAPVFIVGGISIIGYALYRYYLKQIDFVKDIQYQITGVNVLSIDASRVSLEILSKIYNASNVEASVEQMFLEVKMNGIKVAEINEMKDINIQPSKFTDISFVLNFNPRLLGQNLLNLITLTIGAKDIFLDITGFVKVKSGVIRASIPFKYQNNLYSLIKKK